MAKAKKKAVKKIQRTKMTKEAADKFLAKHLKERDLKGKAAEEYTRHHAATRLAALERYSKKVRKAA